MTSQEVSKWHAPDDACQPLVKDLESVAFGRNFEISQLYLIPLYPFYLQVLAAIEKPGSCEKILCSVRCVISPKLHVVAPRLGKCLPPIESGDMAFSFQLEQCLPTTDTNLGLPEDERYAIIRPACFCEQQRFLEEPNATHYIHLFNSSI